MPEVSGVLLLGSPQVATAPMIETEAVVDLGYFTVVALSNALGSRAPRCLTAQKGAVRGAGNEVGITSARDGAVRLDPAHLCVASPAEIWW